MRSPDSTKALVSFSTLFFLLTYLCIASCVAVAFPLHENSSPVTNYSNKQTLEFDLGGHRRRGSGHKSHLKHKTPPPPPPPPVPPPQVPLRPPQAPPPTKLPDNQKLVFADQRLKIVYPIIQNFKSLITSDPLNITKTWVGSNICSYKGFYCDSPPNNSSAIALASIDFNGFQLGLPDIALFHANSNNFSGTVSPAIANLPYLYELDISNNQFSGAFPSAVLGMNTLGFLDIRFNFFTGAVPPQIFNQELVALFLNNNNFMHNLPDNLGSSHILLLTLANNKFTGSIPSGISKAFAALTEVLLLNNQLTGCLPYEIGLLKQAVVLDFGNNQLTGPLPFSLACLENVEQLNFAGNLLHGMVPEVLCHELQSLANFSLSDNYFTNVGPICRSLIGKGVLDVTNNCVPDLLFQRPVEECADFFAHPRFCPFMWTYTYIPCKLPGFGSLFPPLPPPP
ncbi:hypothetical protein D8674_015291 [Pyrus ussuriensis x Pyrus communis]|uniref:Leucine-rich repeat extensin-like protein 4 n=1 Tax=Pyrus ussuriensis x Pyrus communis TaxID=2448454 RepID=A0A5N5H050_9ROSA|nr:hypothetical protein D8674_015291 [Pyrus ussuriensis x Pyrus communis]